MSGIAALYHMDNQPVRPDVVPPLCTAIAHRGPDGTSSHVSGPVALAHAALLTTPESVDERQPLIDETHGLSIVFDGRIDDREDLITALTACAAKSDAQLVLQAYARWGEACPERLLGDFAFAIWDRRQRRLFCARDILGVKPFYYAMSGRTFVCGSTIRVVVEASGAARSPNEGMVAEFLENAITSQEETLLEGVLRLPAAHSLSVGPDGLKKWRYWEPGPLKQIRYRRQEQYVEHFGSLFKDAVRCRLRSQTTVGAELSGGLDSSFVASVANRLSEEQMGSGIRSFSTVFPGWDCDESRYSQEVVSHGGLSHTATSAAFPGQPFYLDRDHAYDDFPGFPNTHVSRGLKTAAHASGCRVLLTGGGGDEWFFGSRLRYADHLRHLQIVKCVRQIHADSGGLATRAALLNAWRFGMRPLIPQRVRRGVGTLLGRRRRWAFVTDRFARRVDLADRINRPAGWHSRDHTQQKLCDLFTSGAWSYYGEVAERFTAEQGLEQRHPFYDRRLIEFALSIPGDQHWHNGQNKRLLRQAMSDVVPCTVRDRKTKAEFSQVFTHTLTQHGGQALFDNPGIADPGWLDVMTTREAGRRIDWEKLTARQFSIVPLWNVYGVELWYRALFSKSDPSGSMK